MAKTRRTHDEVLADGRRAVELAAGGMPLMKALATVHLDKSSFYQNRNAIEAGTSRAAGNSRANGHEPSRTDQHLAAAAARVAEVDRQVAAGVDRRQAFKSNGFSGNTYYYWRRRLTLARGGAPGLPVPVDAGSHRRRLPVATVDPGGVKLVPISVILDAIATMRMSIPDLEQVVGLPPGTVEGYMRQGMCPNALALAVNGLMVETKTNRTGAGGYVTKKDLRTFLVKLPGGHLGILSNFVEHLGGEVLYREA